MLLDEAYARITDAERERSFVMSDPARPDNPIVFANDAFLRLTGYARDEVMGHNCRFLQTPETDGASAAALREAMTQPTAITVDILNRAKDGTPFWNRLRIRPIFGDDGSLENFVGVQNPINADDVRASPLWGIASMAM
ncbi:PAS domain S-box-containing protein [Limimonas halophila]|uniref:PAS domain S-box-containing protein n=2 Tax=Limimonas halophila TaxID=1082479 RepID=A0A1G7TUN6_9PROT|nr:PAS domain S-box-containing protein [Limimonas halophila]